MKSEEAWDKFRQQLLNMIDYHVARAKKKQVSECVSAASDELANLDMRSDDVANILNAISNATGESNG